MKNKEYTVISGPLGFKCDLHKILMGFIKNNFSFHVYHSKAESESEVLILHGNHSAESVEKVGKFSISELSLKVSNVTGDDAVKKLIGLPRDLDDEISDTSISNERRIELEEVQRLALELGDYSLKHNVGPFCLTANDYGYISWSGNKDKRLTLL
jgi:hypothetical protein